MALPSGQIESRRQKMGPKYSSGVRATPVTKSWRSLRRKFHLRCDDKKLHFGGLAPQRGTEIVHGMGESVGPREYYRTV